MRWIIYTYKIQFCTFSFNRLFQSSRHWFLLNSTPTQSYIWKWIQYLHLDEINILPFVICFTGGGIIGLYMTIIVVLYKDRVWAWFEKTMIFLIKADGCLLSDFRLWDLRDYFLKCLKLLRKEKKNWKTFSSSGLLQSLVNYSVGYGVQ